MLRAERTGGECLSAKVPKAALLDLLPAAFGPWGLPGMFPSRPPTDESVRRIKAKLRVKLPPLFVEVAPPVHPMAVGSTASAMTLQPVEGVRIWIEQGSSIHLKAVEESEDPVELSEQEAELVFMERAVCNPIP